MNNRDALIPVSRRAGAGIDSRHCLRASKSLHAMPQKLFLARVDLAGLTGKNPGLVRPRVTRHPQNPHLLGNHRHVRIFS